MKTLLIALCTILSLCAPSFATEAAPFIQLEVHPAVQPDPTKKEKFIAGCKKAGTWCAKPFVVSFDTFCKLGKASEKKGFTQGLCLLGAGANVATPFVVKFFGGR